MPFTCSNAPEAFTTPPDVTLPESEATFRALFLIALATSGGCRYGRRLLISPTVPVTSGAEAEVPSTGQYPPPIFVVRMPIPGAAMKTFFRPEFDQAASRSKLSVEATAIRSREPNAAG